MEILRLHIISSFEGAKGPGNFDPGAVNTNMGKTGMSLNMFGGKYFPFFLSFISIYLVID